MLIQAKGFSRQALDTISSNGGAERARCYRQAQPRIGFMVRQYRQAKIRIGKSFAALLHLAKFGRLVQTLARLERQFTDRWAAYGIPIRGRDAYGPSRGAEQATADRSW
jgi:hypothetical protein